MQRKSNRNPPRFDVGESWSRQITSGPTRSSSLSERMMMGGDAGADNGAIGTGTGVDNGAIGGGTGAGNGKTGAGTDAGRQRVQLQRPIDMSLCTCLSSSNCQTNYNMLQTNCNKKINKRVMEKGCFAPPPVEKDTCSPEPSPQRVSRTLPERFNG